MSDNFMGYFITEAQAIEVIYIQLVCRMVDFASDWGELSVGYFRNVSHQNAIFSLPYEIQSYIFNECKCLETSSSVPKE